MREKPKKGEIEHQAPATLPTDGVDAWYMMQRQREKELRKRRQEAEQILRGYRAPYQNAGDVSSPRYQRGRASFGGTHSDSLTDPASPKSDKRHNHQCHNYSIIGVTIALQ